MGRVHTIQVLRCVAVAMVVLVHCNLTFTLGSSGVDIFFVISGFIIARVSKRRGAIAFLADRARRIYPMWWIAALPFAAYSIALHGVDRDRLLATASLWPVYGDYVTPYLAPGWSLSFELLFYMATALVVWRRSMLVPIVAAYTAALVAGISTGLPLLRFVGNPVALEFMLGVGIAMLPELGRRAGMGFLVLALVGFLLSIHASGDLLWVENLMSIATPWRFGQWGLPAAALVAGALQFERLAHGRIVRALEYCGDASYSIYLTHLPVVLALRGFAPWPAVFLAAFAAGLLAYRLIEQPLTRRLGPPRTPVLREQLS